MPEPLKLPELADPTLGDVLDQFLTEQQARLKPKTYGQYASVVDLFRHHMNAYGHEDLSKAESLLFERHYNAEGADHKEFCQIFGPDKIVGGIGMFLGYFMIRKVMAGADLKRAAGTVTKKLSKWLAEKGYLSDADADEGAQRAGRAVKTLPKADRAAKALSRAAESVFVDLDDVPDEDYLDFDHYLIARLEPGKLWFDVYDGGSPKVVGPVTVPKAATNNLAEGWDVSCTLVRVRGKWRIAEVANVYPM